MLISGTKNTIFFSAIFSGQKDNSGNRLMMAQWVTLRF